MSNTDIKTVKNGWKALYRVSGDTAALNCRKNAMLNDQPASKKAEEG